MSRFKADLNAYITCFPRVSGDEPTTGAPISIEARFSPRERG